MALRRSLTSAIATASGAFRPLPAGGGRLPAFLRAALPEQCAAWRLVSRARNPHGRATFEGGERRMMERSWIPYCGAAPLPGDWLARWNGDPWLLLALGLIALLGLRRDDAPPFRSEEHTSELQSLMRISYAVFCLNKKTTHTCTTTHPYKLS